MKDYFMKTDRIGFSTWKSDDIILAHKLWGEKNVTKFICSNGIFSDDDIKNRLSVEVNNMEKYNIQYWPIFDLSNEDLIGCCGLRPFDSDVNAYELGCHLREKYWRQGYALEGIKAVIKYAFNELNASKIYIGHHPDNIGSKKLLEKIDGIKYIGKKFYEPTGLYHPAYEIENYIKK